MIYIIYIHALFFFYIVVRFKRLTKIEGWIFQIESLVFVTYLGYNILTNFNL